MARSARLARLCLGVCLVASLKGCSSPAPPLVPKQYGDNLALILTAYCEAFQKLERPPQGMQELKPFLVKLGNPDKILVSPHDGRPYEILWGVDPRGTASGTDPAAPQAPLVVHERTGVNGIRYVATGMGVFRMSDQEFERARQATRKR